ncbi:penicillin-binding protein [Bacillus sp. BGMRC 2118]|nr:penicillin-binding protein [Bacillus sp. BGMRC 2118]
MYPAYRTTHHHDQRFPFYPALPFLAGLAVSPFLYGPRPYYGYGYWGPRPRPYYPPFYGPGYWW